MKQNPQSLNSKRVNKKVIQGTISTIQLRFPDYKVKRTQSQATYLLPQFTRPNGRNSFFQL